MWSYKLENVLLLLGEAQNVVCWGNGVNGGGKDRKFVNIWNFEL